VLLCCAGCAVLCCAVCCAVALCSAAGGTGTGAAFPLSEPNGYRQFMLDSEDPTTEASIDQPYVDFGSVSPIAAAAASLTASTTTPPPTLITGLTPSHTQLLTVTNRTAGKLLAMWDTAEWDGGAGGSGEVNANGAAAGAPPLFVVTPNAADVLPYSKTTFRVTFYPTREHRSVGRSVGRGCTVVWCGVVWCGVGGNQSLT
jgi:hypothetical protein